MRKIVLYIKGYDGLIHQEIHLKKDEYIEIEGR